MYILFLFAFPIISLFAQILYVKASYIDELGTTSCYTLCRIDESEDLYSIVPNNLNSGGPNILLSLSFPCMYGEIEKLCSHEFIVPCNIIKFRNWVIISVKKK